MKRVNSIGVRHARTFFMLSVVSLFGLASMLIATDVLAAPKGPAGQTCKSSGTTTVNGKEEGTGRAMKCTADYCKYDECEGGLHPAGKCYEKTSYSNVRDCKPAAMTGPQSGIVVPPTGGVLQQAPASPGVPPSKFQRAPIAPGGGVMQRGVEGDQPDSGMANPSGTRKFWAKERKEED